MKINKCELVFILDRSGSMGGLESDTIGGFNSMINKQKNEVGEATITSVLFDDKYELLHDRIDLKDIQSITAEEYYVRGTTALLDAMGKTINKIRNVQKHSKADRVLFVIITDGLENASKEYTHTQIKKMITDAKDKNDWEFIFLGANIDAISTAKNYGINPERAANYHADSIGTEVSYSAVSNVITQLRAKNKISTEWKVDLDEDYNKRKNN